MFVCACARCKDWPTRIAGSEIQMHTVSESTTVTVRRAFARKGISDTFDAFRGTPLIATFLHAGTASPLKFDNRLAALHLLHAMTAPFPSFAHMPALYVSASHVVACSCRFTISDVFLVRKM